MATGTTTSAVTDHKLYRMIEQVRSKLNYLDAEKVAKLDEGMAIDFMEHFKFQEMQAQAHVSELLTPDAAQVVYIALGPNHSSTNGGWSSKTDTPTKIVVTQLMSELLERKIKSRT